MNVSEFLKITKGKVIYLGAIFLIILISGILASNTIQCIQAPCGQSLSSEISEKVYSFVSFNEFGLNTQFALTMKNALRPIISTGTTYFLLSLIISVILHYILISLIVLIYNKTKLK